MRFLKNIHPFKVSELGGFVKVFALGKLIGWTPRDFALKISHFNDVWLFADDGLRLNPRFTDMEARTKAVDDTFVAMADAGIVPAMPDYSAFGGVDWLPALAHEDGEITFIIKRFYYSFLGIQNHSVILNGYTGDQYWAAIRSQNVESAAGKLDVIVAGTIRHGETVREALIHESHDEACLSESDLREVRTIGKLHMPNINARGFLHDEWLYVFDLDLKDKKPEVGLPIEVDGFKLMTMEEVIDGIQQGDVFKEHINLVVTDFLIRHGYLDRQHEKFEEIKNLLYRENYALTQRA